MSVQQEIEKLFRDYEALWDTQQYRRLGELWDGDDPEPFYLAEEQENWRIGWDELNAYWEPTPGKRNLEAIRMRYRDLRIKTIGDDMAIVACWVRHDMKLKGPMKATGGDARVMVVLRRKPEGWRICAYCEGPMSPVLFMHKLYELNVSPEFESYRREVIEREAGEAASGARRTG